MAEDDVLQKAKELLERSAVLQRELEQFYQREAEQEREVGPLGKGPAADATTAPEDQNTDIKPGS
jgi:hypothetical protein